MMKKNIYLLLLLFSLSSCEKDADIVINEMSPQLVVSSMLSNNPLESNIKITLSKGFKRNNYDYELLTDALVKVTDNQGNEIIFQPDNEGVYKTTTSAIAGRQYTLDIKKSDYHITSQAIMPDAVTLEDFEMTDTQHSMSSLLLQFQDPSPQTDYYMVKVYFKSINTPDFEYLAADFLVSDYAYNEQTHRLNVGRVRTGSTGTFRVVLTHINKGTYNYLETLKNLNSMNYGDSPFVNAVPGNPNTNIQGGIGYFMTGTIGTKEKIINTTN